ncbi:acyltransferase family protein, partial [Paraburkholderia aspalathi]
MAITLNLSASANLNKSLKIDAIRFLAAVWVLMYHFKPPAFKELLPHQLAFLGGALWSGSTALFAGPAAVIVFFVISGYCIHNAYQKDVTLKPINYYASRFIRIGLPLVILLCLVQPLPTGQNYLESVLWSLYCEMVYYAAMGCPFNRSQIVSTAGSAEGARDWEDARVSAVAWAAW